MTTTKNEVKNVVVTQLDSREIDNKCPWKEATDKKKVIMVRVKIVYYTDSKGNTDTVSMECCREHQDEAEESLMHEYNLKHA